MTELLAIGLNHKGAPVQLREQLAIADGEHVTVLEHLRACGLFSELMMVSTCNRVEIYGVTVRTLTDAFEAFEPLAELRKIDPQLLRRHVFVRASSDAARHIFRVAASLESLVVGEPQILGQVKESFMRAKDNGLVGPVLDRCLSLAFKSAKRVRSETEIARGGASVPSVAVDLARSIFGDLQASSALIVGAGEMAEQAAVHLQAAGVPEIVVVNRSEDRGTALANKVGGRFEPWDRLTAQLSRADVVVTSTGAQLPIIDRARMKAVLKARKQRPLFLVDIAVPRDVDPAIAKMDHVFLYNVDDLQGIVHDNLRSRHGEADRAAALVEEEVRGFLQWMRARSIGPTMGRLQAYGREIVEAELSRAFARMPDLSEQQRAIVEQMGRTIAQKLLHRPMASVRQATEQPIGQFDGLALADALTALFDLEALREPVREKAAPEPVQVPTLAVATPSAKVPRPEPT